jgi:hypothetical protein
VKVDILLTSGKHLHDRIISLRGEIWAHHSSLTLPLFIEVSVSSQDNGRHVLEVSNLPLSTIFYIYFGIVGDFFVFHFISTL